MSQGSRPVLIVFAPCESVAFKHKYTKLRARVSMSRTESFTAQTAHNYPYQLSYFYIHSECKEKGLAILI